MKDLGEGAPPGAALFLLTLDTEQYTYKWVPYRQARIKQAQQDYLAAEEEIQSTPGRQAVLVSADSMDAVRVAYPNFYADTRAFIYALQNALRTTKENPETPDPKPTDSIVPQTAPGAGS